MIQLLLALAAAQSPAPPAPPPPPIVRTSTPPPPIHVVNTAPPPITRIYSPDSRLPPVTLEVRVSGEDGLMWQGSLRVGAGAGASVSQSRAEAQPANCMTTTRDFERSPETSFRLSVSALAWQDPAARYNLGIQWTRPGSPDSCAESGSRTVQLQQTVTLAAGQETVLRGDAGLEIRLKRR